MKTLIMLSAVPAAGKTTWAKKYQQENENVYIINSDEVRMEVTGGVYHDHTRQKEVWELFEKRMHEYANLHDDVTVILDALNDVNTVRYKYLSTTPEYDRKILVLFPTSLDKSQKYNGERPWPNKVPDDVLITLVNKFEEPSKEVLDLVDEVITIQW